MIRLRMFVVFCLLSLCPGWAVAEDRLARVFAPPELIETGVLKFILPRFSLKTQVRVELVEAPDQAGLVIGQTGQPLFSGLGRNWHVEVRLPDHPGTAKLAAWLSSDVGLRTITGYAPDGDPLFDVPQAAEVETVALEFDGDPALGQAVSRAQCGRCHKVDDQSGVSGIGSTPSFAVLRSLPNWEERFTAFYALNPHPAFTMVEDLTPPFPPDRPSPIVPVTLTLDEVEAILAFVASLPAADLGAPLIHQ